MYYFKRNITRQNVKSGLCHGTYKREKYKYVEISDLLFCGSLKQENV